MLASGFLSIGYVKTPRSCDAPGSIRGVHPCPPEPPSARHARAWHQPPTPATTRCRVDGMALPLCQQSVRLDRTGFASTGVGELRTSDFLGERPDNGIKRNFQGEIQVNTSQQDLG